MPQKFNYIDFSNSITAEIKNRIPAIINKVDWFGFFIYIILIEYLNLQKYIHNECPIIKMTYPKEEYS